MAEDATNDPCEIERSVEYAVHDAVQALLGDGSPGESGGAHKNGRFGLEFTESLNERKSGEDFADGNGMQPNGAWSGLLP